MDSIIQKEMTRHRERGIDYGRAATLSVDTDRVPVCQAASLRTQNTEKRVRSEDREKEDVRAQDETHRPKEELRIWSLNVRSIATEAKLKELEQEAERSKSGILLLQETWRKETAEQIKRKLDTVRNRKRLKTKGEWDGGVCSQQYPDRIVVLHLVQNHGGTPQTR